MKIWGRLCVGLERADPLGLYRIGCYHSGATILPRNIMDVMLNMVM